ncbi:uncharacterized protein LOC132740942 [Ruditapes philippinarum]|uniref:uncharacterized protein LOC132740942 n=1 Tax=Ruditapes philippinarum TaxID=129788 RepID=UPI00295A6994|nr:uncharacterized protein LOC132740942 [Ruditapes philippinarum]
MNTFQIVAMTIVKVLCVLVIYKQTWSVNAQKSDTNWQAVYNSFYRDPYEVDQLMSPDISQYNRPQLAKRKIDRFRFFHRGIGKRSTELFLDDTKQTNDEIDDSNMIYKIQKMLTEGNDFGKGISSNQQYILARQPDFLFKKIQQLRNLQIKRAPEFFSENLYPLQSGKQKLEATLDQTLNSDEDDFDNNNLNFDNSVDNVASNTEELSNEVPHKNMATKSPFDISFASPDLDIDFEKQDKNNLEHIEQNVINKGQKSKRWWAANMFSKFRSPKSWNRRVTNAIHADPAIYFIGLGR